MGMLISTRCIHGFMSNSIKKSWTVSCHNLWLSNWEFITSLSGAIDAKYCQMALWSVLVHLLDFLDFGGIIIVTQWPIKIMRFEGRFWFPGEFIFHKEVCRWFMTSQDRYLVVTLVGIQIQKKIFVLITKNFGTLSNTEKMTTGTT